MSITPRQAQEQVDEVRAQLRGVECPPAKEDEIRGLLYNAERVRDGAFDAWYTVELERTGSVEGVSRRLAAEAGIPDRIESARQAAKRGRRARTSQPAPMPVVEQSGPGRPAPMPERA